MNLAAGGRPNGVVSPVSHLPPSIFHLPTTLVSLLEEKERKGFQRHLCLSSGRKAKERRSKPPVTLSERKGKERLPNAPPSLLEEKKRKGFRNTPCLSFERKGKAFKSTSLCLSFKSTPSLKRKGFHKLLCGQS